MTRVEEIKAEIDRLPEDDLRDLCRWILDKEWLQWDERIAADSREGRLDFIVDEIKQEQAEDKLENL